MRFHRHPRHRTAFTLVELLTVIGIISLLIGILLPSLSRARGQARKVAVAATIDAIGKGLEMFRNDFGAYPDSTSRPDPINWTNGTAYDQYLDGAHWLARALSGHDSLGVDAKGDILRKTVAHTDRIPLADLAESSRKGTYLEGKVFARDNDSRFQQGGASSYVPQANISISRPVVYDTYNFPILYYRANARSRWSFSRTGLGTADPTGSNSDDSLGIYNQMDNASITGGYSWNDNYNGVILRAGWDFAGAGLPPGASAIHYLGDFGIYPVATATLAEKQAAVNLPPWSPSLNQPNPDRRGKTFVNYLHNENALSTGNVVKPLNPDTFILISAGEDGIYGTDDDVTNFKKAL